MKMRQKSNLQKKVAIGILSILILNVFAISSISALNEKSLALPDNPLFYSLFVKFPEKFEMFFTFNEKLKLEKSVVLVDKRTEEINSISNINIIRDTINEKIKELENIKIMMDSGIIDTEQLRVKIQNRLQKIKQKQRDDLEDFPIILPEPEKAPKCGGIQGLTCPEGYICTCDFSQDCKFDKLGTCTKRAKDIIDETRRKISCPMIYNPVCGEDGKTYPNECVMIQNNVEKERDGQCEKIEPGPIICDNDCLYIETENEGYYDSCSRKPIKLGKCKFDPIPCINQCPSSYDNSTGLYIIDSLCSDECNIPPPEEPIIVKPEPNPIDNNPIKKQCTDDVYCQNMFRSCYFKCLDGTCNEIMTFVKLPDYPSCNIAEPQPIPLPGPMPNPGCQSNKECIDSLKNCNGICNNGKCILLNTFAPVGKYPDCGVNSILT